MPTPTPPITWTETTPGTWEREIDEVENFYTTMAALYSGTGHSYFAITAHLTLSIPVPSSSSSDETSEKFEKALRYAWRRIKFDFPNLAAPAEWDGEKGGWKKVYKVLGEGREEKELEDTFKVVEGFENGAEWANSDPVVPRHSTLYLVVPKEKGREGEGEIKRDIVFRTTHDLIDGVGTLILLSTLLYHLSKTLISSTPPKPIVFGKEYLKLTPSFRTAAALPETPSPAQKERLESILAANKAVREEKGVETLVVPFNKSITKPGISHRQAVRLSLEESAAVLKACKALGITPTHAFHAAMGIAFRDWVGNLQSPLTEEKKVRYVSYSMINLRNHCHEPWNGPAFAAGVWHCTSDTSLVVDLVIPSPASAEKEKKKQTDEELRKEFEGALKQVFTFYKTTTLSTDEYLPTVPELFKLATAPFDPSSSSSLAPPIANNPSISMSSFGVLEKIFGQGKGYEGFKVQNPFLYGGEYGAGLGCFLSTWGGRMEVSAAFNMAWHGEEEVGAYLEGVKGVVLGGLGVGVGVASARCIG